MSEIYKAAAKRKLRFPSSRGALTVEQVMDLPMTSTTGRLSIKAIATPIAEKLQKGKSSLLDFFNAPATDPEASLQMAIIEDIVATKQQENIAKSSAKAKETEKAQLQTLLVAKKAEAMGALSVAELEAKIKALDV